MPDLTFLYGNDEFAIARKLREYEAAFPDATSAGMNTARLDARTASENDLNTAVNAMPFLAPRRLVILSNPSARYDKAGPRKKFEDFLKAAPDTARVVIHETVEPRDAGRHWLVQWFDKAGLKSQGFMLPKPRDMPGWIVNEAKNQGGGIEPAAASKLAELTGNDTRQAGMEIAKLLAYVNWSRPVAAADVEAVGILSAEPDIFGLVDALATGQAAAAQKSLHRMLETDDAAAIFGMIVRQFRLLLIAREVLDAHGMVPDVQEALSQVEGRSVHEFVAEKTTGQAKRFTLPVLESIYRRLLVMDEQAKTSQVPLDLALDLFVSDLAR